MAEEPDWKSLLKKLKIYPGINEVVFEGIKLEVPEWSQKKKYCTISFDQIPIEPNLDYDYNLDLVIGFASLPGQLHKPTFATHALIFMVNGAVFRWTQHIAVYFCESIIPKEEMKLMLEEVVSAVLDTGLVPIALIASQRMSFQMAIRDLQREHAKQLIVDKKSPALKGLCTNCNDYSVIIKGTRLNIIYDPRHLLKGIRNHFAKKNMIMNDKVAKWKDVVDIYVQDRDLFKDKSSFGEKTGLLRKLHDDDIIPEKIDRQKVDNCPYIFSMTMASVIGFIRTNEERQGRHLESNTVWNTVEVLVFFDKLFDSVNGMRPRMFKSRSTGRIKRLRTAVTEESRHHDFWNKAIKQLRKIKFVNENGKKVSTTTVKNWIITIKSFKDIYKYLTERKVKAMKPRYFSMETLEQFFSNVKAANANKQLTCINVLNSFKNLLILDPHDDSDAESDDSHDTFASFENYMRNNVPNYDEINLFLALNYYS